MQEPLKQRLAMTTGAAAAALGPAAAQGAGVYNNTSPLTATFNTADNSHDWDVDGDGQTDFRLAADRRIQSGSVVNGYSTYSGSFITSTHKYSVTATANVGLTSHGLGGRGLVKQGGGSADFRRLAADFAVGPTLASGYGFSPPGLGFRRIVDDSTTSTQIGGPSLLPTASVMYSRLSASIDGDFQDGQFGSNYIGFRFDISGATHYGWAELFVDDGTGTGSRGDITIAEWAYEDTADCGLDVGQTSGDNCTTPSVPNPGTLALLAAGAAGLRRWRGKAKAEAA